jgi:hypothetical protein
MVLVLAVILGTATPALEPSRQPASQVGCYPASNADLTEQSVPQKEQQTQSEPAQAQVASPAPGKVQSPAESSSGTTAQATSPGPSQNPAEIKPVATRWRTYDLQGHPEFTFHIYDPYHQNILKADYPLRGNWFLELNAFNNVVYKSRRNLDFSAVFADQITAGTLTFVPHNQFLNENILFGAQIQHNDDTFVPSNFKFRVNGVTDAKRGINAFNDGSNTSSHLFDAFVDVQLFDFGERADAHSNYDLLFLRGGLQGFKSEFHGLIFNDAGLGGRVFGELKKNRLRYDFAYFKLFQKNAVSGFIDFSAPSRHQVAIARFSWDDLVAGWNSEWTFHYNRDHRTVAGTGGAVLPGNLDTYYTGATFNGHLGRITFNPAIFGVFGHADAAQSGTVVRHSVAAWTGLLDWQFKLDWWNFRLGYLYASGDGNPNDTRDTGFDAISDGVQLFGGPLSYWVGENIKFGKGDFVRANSLFPSFRGVNGVANHINPGLHAMNAGADITISPRFDFSANLNVLAFANTGAYTNRVLIAHRPAGVEENFFLRWRPFLSEANQNVIIDTGFSVLQPLQGLRDAFRSDRTVFSTFLAFRLVY